MITYGFFNSVNGDRKYNAESFNKYFEGLISTSGVFEHVGGGLKVVKDSGLSILVDTGKALINYRWVKLDSPEGLTLTPAHGVLNRYDMVVLRWNESNRNISLNVVTGTPATSPTKPNPARTVGTYEIALAYVYVRAGATEITAGNITDTRPNTTLCGIVHGLIDQVDISELYDQYLAKFDELLSDMGDWKQTQKDGFDAWLSTLTDELLVNTFIDRKQAEIAITTEKWYVQIPSTLNYTPSDILDVYLNGLICTLNVDYTIQENEVEGGYMVKFVNNLQTGTNQVVTLNSTKSRIGWSALTDQGTDLLTDNEDLY